MFWAQISELSLVIQHLAKKNCFLGKAVQKFRFLFDIVFQKDTIKIGFFLERVAIPIASKKPVFTNCQLVTPQNVCFIKKISDFLGAFFGLKPLFL